MFDDENRRSDLEWAKWEACILEQNRQVTRMAKDVIIRNYIQSQSRRPRARRVYRDRERENGEQRLMEDYFVANPTYDAKLFRRRFRMQKPLFHRIVDDVTANDKYFQQRRDATGRQVDEYLKMSATVTREALMRFVEGVISCFGDEYLRLPNEADLARLLYAWEQRGFPGRSGKPTIILEAVASYDLWIWHAFFGTPSSLNDINVIHRSPVFNDVLAGRAPKVTYMVNGHKYDMTYYLTDDIYPSWAAFVKSIRSPLLRKHKLFAEHQEAVRKDVEQAFGVLQARFAFLRRPCLVWDEYKTGQIMIACIILHNMIVEDERETYTTYYDPT